MTVLVLDTSAFIMGFNPLSASDASYSVPSVGEEMIHDTLAHLRFRTSIDHGVLRIRKASVSSTARVREECGRTGEEASLSVADKEVLALALDLTLEGEAPVIVSDDYALQNLADSLGLRYRSLANYGIKYQYKWTMFCPACFRRFKETLQKDCPICGTRLRRKPLRERVSGRA